MYAGVPIMTPVMVIVVLLPSSSLAIPRSTSFGVPSSEKSMLSGFMSRWMIPARWDASSASATSIVMPTASRTGRLPDFLILSARLPPPRYSIRM